MSYCAICGSRGYDGAIDQFGDYVCVDCWANGEAYLEDREAEIFVPADFYTYVDYPEEVVDRFIETCNRDYDDVSDEYDEEVK